MILKTLFKGSQIKLRSSRKIIEKQRARYLKKQLKIKSTSKLKTESLMVLVRNSHNKISRRLSLKILSNSKNRRGNRKHSNNP